MNAPICQRMSEKLPAIGQRVRVFLHNFTGMDVVDGVYNEVDGQPMIGDMKIHPLRTEWRPEITAA